MINEWKDLLKDKISSRKIIKGNLADWKAKHEEALQLGKDLEEVRSIFQQAAQVTQYQLGSSISKIVSNALAAVFSDPYEFKVSFEKRRNVTECDLLFVKNGIPRNPLRSCGYGAADIASLALRVAYWKLDNESRNVFILDEPTRNLDVSKQPLASLMIKKLSESGIQFLIVTHRPELAEAADRTFKVDKQKYSKVEQEKE